MFVHCPLHVISIAKKVNLQLYLYTVVSISRSQSAGQKTSQNLEQARKTELNVAGKKNAALFEWAAFVKAEK